MQYEREADRGPMDDRSPDEPLGELRPVDHLPGHLSSEWKPWPPPDDWPPEDNVIIRTTEGGEHRAWKGDWREDKEWRDEASGKKLRAILSTAELAALRWKPAGKDEPESRFAGSCRASMSRAADAYKRIGRVLDCHLPSPESATSGDAAALDLLAHQLERIDRLTRTDLEAPLD